MTLTKATKRFRRNFICSTMVQTGGNASKAAAILGTHRNTITRAMRDVGGVVQVRGRLRSNGLLPRKRTT